MKQLITFAVLLVGLSLPAMASAQFTPVKSERTLSGSHDSILLRNVQLIDPANPSQLLEVNILIGDDKLDLVTQDLVPLEDAEVAYDGRGGVALGQLTLGEPASFMLMDGNPQNNIEETPEERQRAQAGWMAYAPPPLAVPLDYQDSSKFNRFDTGPVSGILAAAVVLDRISWLDQNSDSEYQVGDLEAYEGGEIRGLRLGGVRTPKFKRPWVWTLFGATHAFDKGFNVSEDDEFSFFDARLDIPVFARANFSIGKQKEPISMERIMSMVYSPMQ